MSWVAVNNQRVELNGEESILAVVRKAGVDLPTLCYHPELSVYGGCRLCLVEVKGRGVVAACHTPPEEGMRIHTNTDQLRFLRKMALELILAGHERECTSCSRSGTCRLQELAERFRVDKPRFQRQAPAQAVDDSGPALIRDPKKCVLCGECVRVCAEWQGIGALSFSKRGARMSVSTAFDLPISETSCVNCGQCAAVCPTGALVVKAQMDAVWQALADPEKIVCFQIAPAVRVAIGEEFGLAPGHSTTGRLAAALRRLGADRVFDTSLAADLTVLEETAEFLERVEAGERLPLFTSCCPAWVKYAEQSYPEYLDNLSSCRSPQQMLGSLVKRYYRTELGVQPDQIVMVSVMPCTAKKFEAQRPEFATAGIRDVDFVITTQELAQMIREHGLEYTALPEEPLDEPFAVPTGAGIIFGVTGGVSEAVLRRAYEVLAAEPAHEVEFTEVRGFEGLRSCELTIGDRVIRLGVVNGLANAAELLREIQAGTVHYDLVEVMACPGGCVGGAGQPISRGDSAVRRRRGVGLYLGDGQQKVRRAQENPAVAAIYERWLGAPGSSEAHTALHTVYSHREGHRSEADAVCVRNDTVRTTA
ncbi:MAG: 4Fe-4S binding protein [Firmicutes bacterium]|jgi:NADH-quinone oxidoreductase subunit G|nr:4Fe-4S binding protein [Bacillota bacterium]